MAEMLLATKLFIPRVPATLVSRPRLVDRLNDGLQQGRSLTLVCAPPGYGKTTLVIEWLQTLAFPEGLDGGPAAAIAWLSLDEHDNDPAHFLAYLVTAIQRAQPGVAIPTPSADRGDPHALEALLTELINGLAGHRPSEAQSLIVVLDDYHVIRSPETHGIVDFLLAHQPPHIHLVLASREDPPLPLARLRVRNQITEVRAHDLRFTQDEAARFFERVGVTLSTGAVVALDNRTEGWIAGLQLAALSLQGRHDADEFIAAFSGTHRYVIDYLVEEVLQRQTEDVRDFLYATSIVERLSAGLCDALTGRTDSQAMLKRLERSNLFLIPLDDQREWYRYHQLFADSLAAGLGKQQRLDLHRRAAGWYAANDFPIQAVKHALAAEDFTWAGHLIEEAARTTISSTGNLPILEGWSDLLPQDVLRAHPLLCLYYARSLFFKGRQHAAQRFLDVAAETIAHLPPGAPATSEALAVLLTNRSTFAAMRGNVAESLALAQEAASHAPEGDLATLARLAHARGFALSLNGDLCAAQEAFAEAVHLAELTGNQMLGPDVVGSLAQTYLLEGDPETARLLSEQALASVEKGPVPPSMCAVYLALGMALYAQDDMPTAADALLQSVALARRVGWPHILWEALACLALAQHALGADEAARTAMREAEDVAQVYGIGWVSRRVGEYRARLESVAVPATAHSAPLPAAPASGAGLPLIEPLSEREMEILRLIADGCSNQEIADRLVITVGTAKWHVNQIYGKLGVHTRTQAVARAQALRLL